MSVAADIKSNRQTLDSPIELMPASKPEGLYSSFSFITRPDKDYGAGMFAKLQNHIDGTSS